MCTDHNQPIIWRKGKKVILRPLQETDLPQSNQWINDPNNNLFLAVTWPIQEYNQKEWFVEAAKNVPDKLTLAICTHEGKLIGNTSMDIDLRKQSAVTGTLIGDRTSQEKGFGTDAKMLMLEYAFNWLGLRKVTSKIIAFNGRSQGYAKKCGYRHMATIEKEHYRSGSWHDEIQYVVFRDEWLPRWQEYTQDWTPDWIESFQKMLERNKN